jgi:hypothetical protein
MYKAYHSRSTLKKQKQLQKNILLFMLETFIIIDMILSKHNVTKNKQRRCTMHSHSTIVGVITMLMDGA